jgi:meso-butanediol dehydrogenase / (S,S)-butanediol dehydrogenase / diacetyl reductase
VDVRLVGKVIVITGAGIGLGRALSRRFAKDGETVIALGRTFSKVQALAEEFGAPHFAVECDVQSPDSVRAAFAEIAKRHAKIDVLINNAAIYEPFMVKDATDEQIMAPVLTNFAGPIFTCRAAIPMMEKGAQIINVTSESVALEFPMLSLYMSTKAGLERFSQSLHRELDPAGIRVSVVRAGPMYEEGKTMPTWDPEAAQMFYKLCLENGINMMQRGVSQVASVTDIFRALLDLPPDVRITHVSLEGRIP